MLIYIKKNIICDYINAVRTYKKSYIQFSNFHSNTNIESSIKRTNTFKKVENFKYQ